MSLDPEVRSLLVCPRCRGELDDLPNGLGCPRCRLRYPIEEGVPFMLEELARPWSPGDEEG